jgi:hypothetical protein
MIFWSLGAFIWFRNIEKMLLQMTSGFLQLESTRYRKFDVLDFFSTDWAPELLQLHLQAKIEYCWAWQLHFFNIFEPNKGTKGPENLSLAIKILTQK